MTDSLFDDRAHARRDDPATSHQAADAVTPDIGTVRQQVAAYAVRAGADGFTDAQLSDDLADAGSTVRTRRSELTERNVILNSGRTATYGDSPRQRIVWVHRNFVEQAPPILDGDDTRAQRNAARRATALDYAARFDRYGDSFRKEGRAMFSDECKAVAAILRAWPLA